MSTFRLVFLPTLLWSLLNYPILASEFLVNTTSGIIKGFSVQLGVEAYFGIPFATSPVGPLRFAPPETFRPASPDHVYDGTQVPPACYQLTYASFASEKQSGVAESEDCLTINIWKPAESSGPHAVLIWLYGGGFSSGANSPALYDGKHFVEEQKDIIFVSINYRVNLFGFPNSAALASKNVGLLDQRLGIEWVRDNIEQFGGDTKRMTLMGHSAGSISAALMSFAYADDPILGSLIELSGQPGLLPGDDGTGWRKVANATGCANEQGDAELELECLRGVPPRRLKQSLSPNNQPSINNPVVSSGPVIDNRTAFSPDELALRGRNGAFAKLPLLITHTTHEFDGALPFDPITGVNRTLSDQLTILLHQCPVAATAGQWVAQGVPTYRYVFDGAFAETKPYDWVRSYHGADSNLIFSGERNLYWEAPGQEVLKAGEYLRAAIAAFIRDPIDGLKEYGWPKYTGEGDTLVRLFSNDTATVEFQDPQTYDVNCQFLVG